MGGRRYFRHPELQHHKDKPWVFLDKEGYYVDLDSSIDPSGGARRGHGNKSWGECKRGARDTIMVGLVKDLEDERQDEWQERFDAKMAKIEAYNAETQKINEEWRKLAKRQSLKTVSAAATRAQKPPASVDSHFKRPKPPASEKKKEREAGRAKIQALRAKRQSQGLKVSGPLAQEGQRKIPPEKLGSPDPPLAAAAAAEDADDGPPLNQDPAYAKYFKMLKMGLPMGAVKNAMQRDGHDPSIMDLDRGKSVASQLQEEKEDGPPSPSGLAPAKTTPPRATKKMQTVHVNTVEKEKLPNSLWALGGNADHDIDTEILESLFSEKEKVAAAKSKKIVTLTSLIDSRRAEHIEVSLKSSQFRAFANNFDAICQAVVSLDEQHLNAEKLTIMQSSMLPKQEDLESLQQFSGQHDELGPADRWVFAVTKVPRFPQKLSAFKYSLQFDELIQSLTSSLNLLASACDEVTQNDDLANLLRRLLTIVNTMNKGTRKESFESITLGSLVPIAKKRGGDGKTILLDILVSSVPIEWPGLPAVNAAIRLDLGELRPLLQEIQTGAQGIERSIEAEESDDASSMYLQKLQLFLQNTTGERNDVNALFELVEKKVATLCDYFGEDSKTCKTSTVFGTLLEFSRLVEKSIAALAQKKN